MAVMRLKKEFKRIQKEPVPNIEAVPLDSNILEWHYVVTGPTGSPYAGGYYHGKLVFPAEYPFKPPSIYMLTPSGRFKPNTRLCLSMSDFHPETWNPMWHVSSILSGLLSFMVCLTPSLSLSISISISLFLSICLYVLSCFVEGHSLSLFLFSVYSCSV